MGNPKTRLVFKKLCSINKPAVVFIFEPMVPLNKVNPFFWSALNLKHFIENDRGSLLPNIWGACRDGINPQIISNTSQQISISLMQDSHLVFICVVYAHTNYLRRRALWDDILSLISANQGPWCCIGDLNSVLGANECKGTYLPNRIACEEFKRFSEEGNLHHILTRGAEFTWLNRRRGLAHTEKRLDRSMCNDSWLANWQQTFYYTLPRSASDHHPLMFGFSNDASNSHSHFRFHKMWLKHDSPRRVVENHWAKSMVGCPMYILSKKLKDLKVILKFWIKEVFGNIHLRVNEALSQAEEEFWKEKSRLNWQTSGDRNTSYFHNIAKIRYATKPMCILRHGDDTLLDRQDIDSHVLEYFTNLYASENETQPSNLIDSVIPNLVSEEDNIMLSKIPLEDEIKAVVFAMNGEGAPGPDGFGRFFFQVLADRLATIAPRIISKHQRGFIKDRHIHDCICIASEAINLLDHKTLGGNLALKLDVKKAFDTIDWKFLRDTLKAFGFANSFIQWIEVILNSARLSISVNGHSVGYFSCKRGVRQGDSLSPLLLCLAEEVISRGLTKWLDMGKFSTIVGPRIATPSHVLYADDIMVFCRGIKRELLAIKDLFHEYGKISSQCLNLTKCKFFSTQANARKIGKLTTWLGFGAGSLPFNYLGVPVFKGIPQVIHMQPIADGIVIKLAKWKGFCLSIIGRVELVKSIIHSMLNYSFQVYSWPDNLLKRLDSCIKNFIWSGDTKVKKLVTVAWHKANFYRTRFCRNKEPKSSYIKSSIWPGIKKHWHVILENTIWLLGNGKSISYWVDNWLGKSLVDTLGIPAPISSALLAKVTDFIIASAWIIPSWMARMHPVVCQQIRKTPIPSSNLADKLAWLHNSDGILTSKEAYIFTKPNQAQDNWCNKIWSISIPPSKSFVTWRLYNNRMPIDENLKLRGLSLMSLSTQWSPQLKQVLVSAIINYISAIWFCGNKARFDNLHISFEQAIAKIKLNTSFTGNSTKLCAKPSVLEFSILRAFHVQCNYSKAPAIAEVNWALPLMGWVKINTDGAAKGFPGHSGGGAIFRDGKGECLGCFASYFNIQDSLYAEVLAAIMVVQIDHSKGWLLIWLECDSTSVVEIFRGSKPVPWKLSNLMNKCKKAMLEMQVKVSHIFRDDNACADRLANFGVNYRMD
ncbi:PREDICTED: uncharacterized protein LOC109353976 [Lupinus angustifolius]|uniref:uncharacterized protein LOC109353976 n=1 Tax=Lupinus angustifolius TaxID=3871 RepID=UPI00092E2230|nr:PREDICTED: uncharacterized protein LOC109353976 [Lupinus angustifolius]